MEKAIFLRCKEGCGHLIRYDAWRFYLRYKNALAEAAGNPISAIIFVFSYVLMLMMAVNNVMIAIIKEEFDKRKILIFEEELMIKLKK